MAVRNSFMVAVLSLSLVAPAYAVTHRTRNTEVVEVNAHWLPPAPSNAKHVVVVNSAQHSKRHHGLAGAFQRLHKWHMRQRAHLYRSMNPR